MIVCVCECVGVCVSVCVSVWVCCCHRFSGLTTKDFVSVSTTLEEVQERVLNLVSSDTILLGHSLESDLRALKVDTPPSTTHLPIPSLSSDDPQQSGGHGYSVPPSQGPTSEESTA